ncbi:hypothetical protein JG688_00000859 [Phytophthora aleatoria]|uniref:Uncharacterized protein n=1 Tax=Phytophthora aleatoria TaxID=2496075 RepID=A0A8J5JBW9_9STRA|nr:hypothetical protein JG688_00000859 [Phytophthora aleatoria]
MWAQIFGPRYEDGDEAGDFQEDNQSNADSARESVSSKSSLQAKLARERKLDEQIQASQRRYRERLFDPQELERSNTRTRKGTLIAPLDFAQNGGVSMNIQLQASWFIPFGQLPQLRSLVMKITKRHLNEEKLAIVNRHLQKQLTLLPLSARIQNLVLQLSNYQLKEPHQGPMWPEGKQSAHELAQDLLGCIAVNEAAVLTEHQDYKNSVLVLPVEHVAKTQLSSVVSAQRLVFFRYLIDIVAAERMRLHSKTTEPPELPVQPPARRKTITGRRRSPSKRNPVELAPEKPADDEETEAAHGSLPSASEAGEVTDVPAEDDIFVSLEQIGDECEKPVSQLQQQLESAIDQLRQTLPTIDSDVALNPAIRATYLAAVACHESVLLMVRFSIVCTKLPDLTFVYFSFDQLENNIDVDAAMSNKLEHFIEALQGIQVQADKQTITSTVSEEEDSKSESSTLQTQFPPPYAITSPSYWTFAPSIPEPKSSIAKLVTKSPSNKSADLRSSFLSKESPGVGAYNIQQGEKLTFQRKPSYSFGPTGGDRGNKAPNASLSKGSTGKQSSKSALRQRMKTSLEFVPPMAHSAEDNDIDFDGSTRVHFGSQYDDNHLGTRSNGDLLNDLPPDYDEGDANEDPEERTGESDETEMDRALRLQQRIFMDEFMQQVVSNQESPTHFVPRGKQHFDKTKHSKSAPYWATSEVSPGIERLLHRQRRAPTASKFRPSSASTAPVQPRTARRGVKETPAPPPPPRRQLDNDQHLAWAARISELYQSVPAPEQ